MTASNTAFVLALTALASACIDSPPANTGSTQEEIFFEDGDLSEVPGHVVFIRLIGRHPTADSTGPGYIDYDAYDDYDAHYCGGVLVADDWVLTASHCLYKTFPTGVFSANRYLLRLDQFEVVHGKPKLRPLSTSTTQRRAPVQFSFHPSSYPHGIGTEIEQQNWYGMDWQCQMPLAPFGDDQNDLTTWNHDLALIKLGHPFEGVNPVGIADGLNPLPELEEVPKEPTEEGAKFGPEFPQQSGDFHGWGRTRNLLYVPILDDYVWLEQRRSNVLRYFSGKPIKTIACDPLMIPFIDSSEFCLRADNGQATVSLGDSGGPFVINDKLVGIAHAGVQSSSAANGYSIMTRGSVAKEWVEDSIATGGEQYAHSNCDKTQYFTVKDCRIDGCGEGEHCHDCPDYMCLPSNVWCY